MPDTDETVKAEDAASSPAEGESPPPPPEFPLEWAYLENGETQDSGSAACVIGDDGLYLKCQSGPPFDIPYSEIAGIEDRGVDLVLAMRGGFAFELSKMARMRDTLRAALMEKWTALNRRQALAEETQIAAFTGRAGRSGEEQPKPANIGVYETAVVLDFESGLVQRIPLVFSGRPREENYRFSFSLPGERWTVGFMGRETDRFRAAVEQAVNGLEEKAQKRLRALCPAIPPFKLRKLVGAFLDGLAVPMKTAREASPELEEALIAELGQAGLDESWKACLGLGAADAARIGRKEALKASDGLYRWFFIPLERGGRAAVVMEASSEGSSGRATYVFRVPGGPEAAGAAMDSLNYGLVMVNFRREPIYLGDEQMRKPQYAHYLRSAERVPALAELRRNFVGRVAHTGPEAWRKGLEALLDKL
jgi:hypothetical protein